MNSPSCNSTFIDVSIREWRPNILTSKMSAALISITIVNLLVSPLTIFLNVLVITAVKTTPQLRNKYNVLLACMAGTDIMTVALAQPLFIAELSNLPSHRQACIRVLHHLTRWKTLKSSFRFDFATTFGVDKRREVYIDKVFF